MGMTDGLLRASQGLALRGVFEPQGFNGTLKDTTIRQTATGEIVLNFGTFTSEVDTLICQDKVLLASASATYDLYTGTDLLDIDGQTAALRLVKYVGVFVVSGGSSSGVRVGGAAANTWSAFFDDTSDKYQIFPSGPPFQGGSPAGLAVGSSTKNLKIENLSTSAAVTVRIVIGGNRVVAGMLMGILGLTYP